MFRLHLQGNWVSSRCKVSPITHPWQRALAFCDHKVAQKASFDPRSRRSGVLHARCAILYYDILIRHGEYKEYLILDK